MADISVQTIGLSSINPTYAAASSGGDSFTNNGKTILHVKNTGSSPVTVTVNSQTPCSQGFDHDVVITAANGSEAMLGPFVQSRFNDLNGKVQVTYSDATGVMIAALSI